MSKPTLTVGDIPQFGAGQYFGVPPKTAHRCPICNGRGTVPQGFYTGEAWGIMNACNTVRPTCHTCGGRGIVWE